VRVPAARRLHLSAITAGLVLVAACWTERAASPPLSNRIVTAPSSGWRMTHNGVGPLRGETLATLEELQHLLPRARVVASDLGEASGLVYDVFDGDERVLYVVPDDVEGYAEGDDRRYDTTIFAVFAVSGRVSIEGRTWRVGQPFTDDARLDRCECWGGGEVTACFRIGTHLRVIFDEPCENATHEGARSMRGKPIARVMWKRVIEPPGLFDD
jgi:hypothetical protein